MARGGDGATSAERIRKVVLGKHGDPCTIQDLYLAECLLGVKLADSCQSVEDLRRDLAEQLPQTSPETRELYAQRICKWLFPDRTLDSAPLAVWRAYGDELLLLDHFRVRYLEAIPLLGKFVVGPLASMAVGAALDPDAVRAFVSRECGHPIPKTLERIPRNLTKLGFLARAGKRLVRTVPRYDPTSVVLELHRVFGRSPATTRFVEVAGHPFWRHVGVPDEGALEHILYLAVQRGLLAKFVRVDDLNQITNDRPYADLLALRSRVPA